MKVQGAVQSFMPFNLTVELRNSGVLRLSDSFERGGWRAGPTGTLTYEAGQGCPPLEGSRFEERSSPARASPCYPSLAIYLIVYVQYLTVYV